MLKHGLVILLQHHLAFHRTDERDGLTYYEANLDGAYALVRAGKSIDIVREKFGEGAAQVASNLLLLGHASVKDLVDSYQLKSNGDVDQNDQPNGTNGLLAADAEIRSLEQLHTTLHKLKRASLVDAVTTKTFMSRADIDAEAASIARRSMPDQKAPRGKKEKDRYDRIVHSLKRRWRDSDMDEQDEDEYGPKRRKTNGSTNGVNGTHGHHYEGVRLRDDLVLKLNHEKINVLIRTQRLTDLAARFVGETSSRVYKALLEIMEEKQPRCFEDRLDPGDEDSDYDDNDDIIVTCADLLDRLPPDLDISLGIAADAPARPNDTNGTNDPEEHDELSTTALTTRSTDDNHLILQIARHLDILAYSNYKFVHRVGTAGGGQYKVEFADLCAALVQLEIEDTVTPRFGNEAARLVRILDRKGKLDEKQLSSLSLIRPRDVKVLLLDLQQAGFLDLQEVPRDAARAPSRTMYLYFFDRDRARRKLLDDAYKVMARLLQRARVERARMRQLIEKAERSDVRGNEDKYLSAAERADLRRWRQKEEKLLIAVGRCDDVVAALRDFLPERED
ncbi:MAG: hypothetical protein INR71_04245 [Terriglobus roseus]|nr:hypothetical protein [Terriglobus roseus]